jgi:hypothetical protein
MAETIVYNNWLWDDFPEDRDIREDEFFWDEVEIVAEELREEFEGG